MKRGAYYNEIDPYAAQWLRNLIAAGLIAPGEVDERSIIDVRPADLAGFVQCHFFAGIGVWSYALRRAGWSDDDEVWTGSCPCQPFSDAGSSRGLDDERHLWPDWQRLIAERRPRVVFGEQVASADGLAWVDFVSSDLEAAGYTFGAVDTCSAGFGAPHIRQRLYFVADSEDADRRRGISGTETRTREDSVGRRRPAGGCADDGRNVADSTNGGRGEFGDAALSGSCGHAYGGGVVGSLADASSNRRARCGAGWSDEEGHSARSESGGELPAGFERPGVARVVGDAEHAGLEGRTRSDGGDEQSGWFGAGAARPASASGVPHRAAGAVNGFWSDAVWIPCRDGKFRAVESGSPPLVAGATARVGRLRAYGNAINAEQARGFIEAYSDLNR